LEEKNVHLDNIVSPGTAENAVPASVQLNNEEMSAIRAFDPIPIVTPMAAGLPESVSAQNSARRPMPPAMPRSEAMPAMPPPRLAMPPQAAVPIPERPHIPKEPEAENCGYKKGELPACAPLAAAFVPFQQKNPPKYAAADALTHGTLFPGLDLPFMNVANNTRC